MRRVLDVGNCTPDHAAICRLIESQFEAQVVQVHGPEDAFEELRSSSFDLVLVNRRLDRDGRDGLEIIRRIKDDSELGQTPCMLITNFAEHQERAIEVGAERGFGKNELADTETVDRLRPFLES